jgi:hypothetical protein
MKKSKKQKNGSKKRSKSDSDWEFDGGTGSNNVNNSATESNRSKKFHSQEKDERMRRGAFKQAIRRREKEAVKKMATKVAFKNLIAEEKPILASGVNEQPIKKHKPNIINSQSPFERLLTFVDTNRKEFTESESSDSKGELHLAQNPVGDLDSVPSISVTEFKDMIEYSLVPYEWFFSEQNDRNCSSEQETKPVLLKGLCKNDSYKLFGNLHRSLLQTYMMDISGRNLSFLQIPGIPKLWSSIGRNQSSLPWCDGGNVLGRSVIPYLVTYSDSFFEVSRIDDEEIVNSEEDVLDAALFHAATHIVRSRFILPNNVFMYVWL